MDFIYPPALRNLEEVRGRWSLFRAFQRGNVVSETLGDPRRVTHTQKDLETPIRKSNTELLLPPKPIPSPRSPVPRRLQAGSGGDGTAPEPGPKGPRDGNTARTRGPVCWTSIKGSSVLPLELPAWTEARSGPIGLGKESRREPWKSRISQGCTVSGPVGPQTVKKRKKSLWIYAKKLCTLVPDRLKCV